MEDCVTDNSKINGWNDYFVSLGMYVMRNTGQIIHVRDITANLIELAIRNTQIFMLIKVLQVKEASTKLMIVEIVGGRVDRGRFSQYKCSSEYLLWNPNQKKTLVSSKP